MVGLIASEESQDLEWRGEASVNVGLLGRKWPQGKEDTPLVSAVTSVDLMRLTTWPPQRPLQAPQQKATTCGLLPQPRPPG